MRDSLQGSETWSCTNGNSIFTSFVRLDRKTLTWFLLHYKGLCDLILCEHERFFTNFVEMDRMSTSLDLVWRIRYKGLWDLILHEHEWSFIDFFGMDQMTTFPRNSLTTSLGMSSHFFRELLASECLDFFSLGSSSKLLHFFFFGNPPND